MTDFFSVFQGADESLVGVYIGILRWVAPVLAAFLLFRCIRPLLTFRREPEIWGWLHLSNERKLSITHRTQ